MTEIQDLTNQIYQLNKEKLALININDELIKEKVDLNEKIEGMKKNDRNLENKSLQTENDVKDEEVNKDEIDRLI